VYFDFANILILKLCRAAQVFKDTTDKVAGTESALIFDNAGHDTCPSCHSSKNTRYEIPQNKETVP
jgi:hypothetical protein